MSRVKVRSDRAVCELLAEYHYGLDPPKFEPQIEIPPSDGGFLITTIEGVKVFNEAGRRLRRPRRDRHPIGERPSELARKRGVSIWKRYGVTFCIGRSGKFKGYRLHRPGWRRDSARSVAGMCGEPIVFEKGQKTAKCRKCGRRLWLAGLPVIYQHDDLRFVKRVINGLHSWRVRGGLWHTRPRIMLWEKKYRAHLQKPTQGGRGTNRLAPPTSLGGKEMGQAPDPTPPCLDLVFNPNKPSDSKATSPVRDLGGARQEVIDVKDSGPTASPSVGWPRIGRNSG